MPRLYEDRKYLNDARTGEHLSTTVMYDGDERIDGTGKVLERLRIAIPIIALKLGGKDLGTRDFIDAFQIRGPNFGDVVRITVDKLVAGKKMVKRNVGTSRKPLYRYDLVSHDL